MPQENDTDKPLIATLAPCVERAIARVREHADGQNGMAGDYYAAFPPTVDEREELCAEFRSALFEDARVTDDEAQRG